MKTFCNAWLFIFFLINFFSIDSAIYLVFGGEKGWIGQKIVKVLQNQNHVAYPSSVRLECRTLVEAEIKKYKPDYIINAAGITGRPNVNWCEDHKIETIRSNVLGLLNLIDIAFLHNLHVTNIATGCIYQYDTQHPQDSGMSFTEEDEPNFGGSFYSSTKIIVEKLIGNYPNVLNLRLRMPISSDLSQRSFIGKIIQYKKLINIPNSMSILDDLLPLISPMTERKLVGNYNFVNPGTLTHNQVMGLYQKYVDPEHQYENFSITEMEQLIKVPRSNCELSADKLLKIFPNIPNIQEAIVNVFCKLKKKVNLNA